MFTGIIQAVGAIQQVIPLDEGVRLAVDPKTLPTDDIALGDSIALNGACMTVVKCSPSRLEFDVSRESLNCTAGLDATGPVNLEKAMRLGDRLGGHLVSGHIDGVGTIRSLEAKGESWELVIDLPQRLSPYVSDKGSIAVDGISLTVNRLRDHDTGVSISINIIPHTWQMTQLHQRRPGDRVNIEVDQLAKQVARMLPRLAQISADPLPSETY